MEPQPDPRPETYESTASASTVSEEYGFSFNGVHLLTLDIYIAQFQENFIISVMTTLNVMWFPKTRLFVKI